MVSGSDLNELRRMVTNLYDEEKACIIRVMRGISDLSSENLKLKAELAKLRAEIAEKKC